MQRIATIKVALAVFGIALLLVSPAGICAKAAGAKSPAHPCCPKSSQHNSTNPGCVCIDRQAAEPSPAVRSQERQPVAIAEAAAAAPVELPAWEGDRWDRVPPGPDGRFERYRQLLL